MTVYETIEVQRYEDVYTVSSASDSFSDSGSYSRGSSRSYQASDRNDRRDRIFNPYGKPRRGTSGGYGNIGYGGYLSAYGHGSSSGSDYASDSYSNYDPYESTESLSLRYELGNAYGLGHSHESTTIDTTSEEGYYRPELVTDYITREHVIYEPEAYIV